MIIKNNFDDEFKKEIIRLILKTIIVSILLMVAKLFGKGFEEMITVVFGSIFLSSKIYKADGAILRR